MSIFQFFRILWARRWVTVMTTVAVLTLGVLVILVVPPRYKAETRVILDVIKPDPVTGQILSSPFLRAYMSNQTELIKDFGVAGRVVADQHLADDPEMQKAYQERKSSDDRDFAHWTAQKIIDDSDAAIIPGSNIIQISYTSREPEKARRIADALREAYIAASLEDRRNSASRNASWYDDQAAKTRAALADAEAAKAQFERENGVLLQDDQTDVDTARLAALASQAATPVLTQAPMGSTAAQLELAQVEADLAQASKMLGPNHPQIIDLKRKRELLIQQIDKDRVAASQAASIAASAMRSTAGLLDAQKAKVMAQREKVEKLKLLQDNVNLLRDQYNKSASRAAELHQEAEVVEAGVTTLGNAITPQKAVFPNKPLVLGGALAGGLGGGIVLALALEILARRVRCKEDLESLVDAPVLAIVRRTPQQRVATGRRITRRVAAPPLKRAEA
ncbi:MAG: hypothetical protein GC203_11345 [Phenylobacterium sp.]|uniref:Wzz/FepE/Etk N-terminal domain-containing protein n=1 Tax=Phenylobacterium sp. TaxID=1871053 RepID=UPI0025E86EAD|nr:Wzz/FepE/Etk N-terminal domain-containing protein [Phenylobacterium sp.]MBI1198446.1 hypothetical protein [Phenylobacterium sp.]